MFLRCLIVCVLTASITAASQPPPIIALIDSHRVLQQVRDLLIDASDTRVLATSLDSVQQERRRMATELATATTTTVTSVDKSVIAESQVREQLVRDRFNRLQGVEQELSQELERGLNDAFSSFLREFSVDRYAAVLERREAREFNLLAGDLAQEDATQGLIDYIRGGAKLSQK